LYVFAGPKKIYLVDNVLVHVQVVLLLLDEVDVVVVVVVIVVVQVVGDTKNELLMYIYVCHNTFTSKRIVKFDNYVCTLHACTCDNYILHTL
jgi:hypothetical protein